MLIAWTGDVASEGKGRWIPEGWALPILVIALIGAVIATVAARAWHKRR